MNYDQAAIAKARAETVRALQKAESYMHDFQKPEQISYYRAHIAYLDELAAGNAATPPKSNKAAWDDMNCVIEARAKSVTQVT